MTDDKSKTTAAKSSAEGSPQALMDEDVEQGFHGESPDPTPNENYTVAGVTSGAPTPETDADLAKEARESVGLGGSAMERAADAADSKKG